MKTVGEMSGELGLERSRHLMQINMQQQQIAASLYSDLQMIPQTHKNLIEIYLFKHYIELVYESRFLFLIEMN